MLAVHAAAAGLALAAPAQGQPATPVEQPSGPSAAPAESANTMLPEPAFAADAPAPDIVLPPPAGDAAQADPLSDPLADPASAPAAAQPVTPAAPSQATPDATVYSADEDFLAQEGKKVDDPLEPLNRISFGLFMIADKIAIRPAAMVYRKIVPKPVRDGARNMLTNLSEPITFANDLLQLRPQRALKTLARFLINSTIGLAGIFDIAKRKPFNIEYHYNTLGSTLGYYGVGPGPYLFLPLGSPIGTGPTTLRDLVDWPQGLLLSKGVGYPFDQGEYDLATTIVGGIDDRERNDDELKAMFANSIDKYASFRENYVQDREGHIAVLKAKDGEAPRTPGFDDPLIDPAGGIPRAHHPAVELDHPLADPAAPAPVPSEPVPPPARPVPAAPAAP